MVTIRPERSAFSLSHVTGVFAFYMMPELTVRIQLDLEEWEGRRGDGRDLAYFV